MNVNTEIDKLVAELLPYEELMQDEYGELLASLLSVSHYKDYFSSKKFANALLKELSTVKSELEENYKIVEYEHTYTQKCKELVMK